MTTPIDRARAAFDKYAGDPRSEELQAQLHRWEVTQFDYQPPVLIRKPEGAVDAKARDGATAKVHDHLARLEKELEGKTWFGGTQFTLADITLAPALTGSLELLGLLPDATRYPNLAAWRDRIAARPAYAASKPKEPLRIRA